MQLKISDCKGLFSSGKMRMILFIAGALAILLLFISTLPSGKEQTQQLSEDTAALEAALEHRLEELLGGINGVTSPDVMVTLDSTSERVFARDSKSGSSETQNTDSSAASGDNESTVVLVGSGSGKDALEQSTILPKVRGVAVVCGGAEDPSIKEKVVNTVSGVLNISSSRVYVTY